MFDVFEQEEVNRFAESLTEAIVGRSVLAVTKAEDGRYALVLDNGAMFEVAGYGECCAYGEIDAIRALSDSQNVITRVSVVEDRKEWDTTFFSVFLLTAWNDEVYALDGSVSQGTGCYSFGWELTLRAAG